jgi:hypothetical protein
MTVQIWLRPGSRDLAAFARFAADEKSLPPPPPPPPRAAPPAPPLPSPVGVEAEEMNLRNLAVRDLAGASKGKAIYFEKEGSRAKSTLKLKKGAYQLQVHLQSRKPATELVTVKLAGKEFRLQSDPSGKLAPGTLRDAGKLRIDVPHDGDFELRLEFAAKDVLVDRVELLPTP